MALDGSYKDRDCNGRAKKLGHDIEYCNSYAIARSCNYEIRKCLALKMHIAKDIPI